MSCVCVSCALTHPAPPPTHHPPQILQLIYRCKMSLATLNVSLMNASRKSTKGLQIFPLMGDEGRDSSRRTMAFSN